MSSTVLLCNCIEKKKKIDTCIAIGTLCNCLRKFNAIMVLSTVGGVGKIYAKNKNVGF